MEKQQRAAMTEPAAFARCKEEFSEPAAEFSPIPFWFWNDELTDQEIIRQIADFKRKGVMGFVIHPRMGLPRRPEYLSEPFLDRVETAVRAAEREGMSVILYDEAMYPSGSAMGRVVAADPAFASRGLKMIEYPHRSAETARVPVNLGNGERLVSAQAIRKRSEHAYDGTATVLLNERDGVVEFSPPPGSDGEWTIVLFVDTPSRGTIRGVHFGQDDGEPDAPPSADLLNPEATRTFIRLTHERYYRRLRRYFGKTVKAFFTDEPNILGRNSLPGLKPWTGGFLQELLAGGFRETDLPALWLDAGEGTEAIRAMYRKAVNARLSASYYKPLSDWCASHGIALTGHPAESDDIGLLEHFQLPGQDVVWRHIAPEPGKSLDGPDSTQGKCSSDAARHRGRRRNLNECFGACSRNGGWSLSMDEMKWYLDWLFVRGVNLIVPHAFYYSVAGERRNERPPDVGPNNIWWPHYETIAAYIKRMSWLMTDSVNVTKVAVLCNEDRLPWEPVKPLYERQIEFNYLEESLLKTKCMISAGTIRIERQAYSVVLVDRPDRFDRDALACLARFIAEGGKVIVPESEAGEKHLPGAVYVPALRQMPEVIDRYVPPEIRLLPGSPDIRVSRVDKAGIPFYLLVNEGEERYEGEAVLAAEGGSVERWDAWTGTTVPWALRRDESGFRVRVALDRRESVVFAVRPDRPNDAGLAEMRAESAARESMRSVRRATRIVRLDRWTIGDPLTGGRRPATLGSWTEWPGMAGYSGTVEYETECLLAIDGFAERNRYGTAGAIRATLDLGDVGEMAQLFVNGTEAGVRMWRPYRFDDIGPLLKPGKNRLTVRVTNSLANAYDGAGIASGLLGPVTLTLMGIPNS